MFLCFGSAETTISPSAVASARAATRHLRRTRNVDLGFLQNAEAAAAADDGAGAAAVVSNDDEDNSCFRGFQIGQVYHYDWTSDLNVRKVAIHQTQRSEHTRDFNIKLKVCFFVFFFSILLPVSVVIVRITLQYIIILFYCYYENLK